MTMMDMLIDHRNELFFYNSDVTKGDIKEIWGWLVH